MPDYLNTFGGIGSLFPKPMGQPNQPVMPQGASQLGASFGLPQNNPGAPMPGQPPQQPMQPMQAQQPPQNPGTQPNSWMGSQMPQKTPVLGMPAMAAGGQVPGYAPGGILPSTSKDSVVKEAQMAVSGKHHNPREAIAKFEGIMGSDATNDLIRAHAAGGRIRGSGGGVDDLVPGSIDGREDVRLASGEYVIPARVVSALGDGDTDRGAEILDDFCARVREAAAQHMAGSDPIDVEALLPEIGQ